MKKSRSQKIFVWIVVLLMCASLIATSIAIVWSIFQGGNVDPNQVTIDINDADALKEAGLTDDQIKEIQESVTIETNNEDVEVTQVETSPAATTVPENVNIPEVTPNQ